MFGGAVGNGHVHPGGGLGHPVALQQLHAAVEPRGGDSLEDGGTAVDDVPQGAEVGAREVRVFAQHLQDGGDGGEAGDALAVDGGQDLAGVETGYRLHGPALEQGGQGDLPESADVEHRGQAQGLVGAEHVDVGELVDGVEGDVAVGEDRALGFSGGSGGVEDQARIVEADRGKHLRRVVAGAEELLVAGARDGAGRGLERHHE